MLGTVLGIQLLLELHLSFTFGNNYLHIGFQCKAPGSRRGREQLFLSEERRGEGGSPEAARSQAQRRVARLPSPSLPQPGGAAGEQRKVGQRRTLAKGPVRVG